MGDTEKKVYISLASVVVVTLAYGVVTTVINGPGVFFSSDTALAGKSILLLMVACVAVNMFLGNSLTIFSALQHDPRSDTECEATLVDERDKQIELSGLQLSYLVFTLGFIASMAALWGGWPPVAVFHLIILSLIVGEIASCLIKIVKYRRGF